MEQTRAGIHSVEQDVLIRGSSSVVYKTYVRRDCIFAEMWQEISGNVAGNEWNCGGK